MDTQRPPDAASTLPALAAPPFPKTFYQRQLPSTCISFSSSEGRAVFASAMAKGGTYSFFPLIEQLQTQPEPAYCGLTTLVMVLNALAVDPRRSWKGPWRWYEESMLNCCVDLEEVKKTGITFSTFTCLARCQGLNVNSVYGAVSTVDEFRNAVKQTCTQPANVQAQPTSFLIVSYNRQVVGQTGTGHFSPIGAYHEESDHVLILDTARFKYGPHWVPLPMMFEALLSLDPDTGKSRGYAVLGYDDGLDGTGKGNGQSHLPLSVLFGSKKSESTRRGYKRYLQDLGINGPGKDFGFAPVISFWTKNYADNNYVWQVVKPQLQPVDTEGIQMVVSLRRLVRTLMKKNEHASSIPQEMLLGTDCQSSHRELEISPAEVLYIIYLASLPLDVRRSVVYKEGLEGGTAAIDVDDTTREQLLAEAALISYAIENTEV